MPAERQRHGAIQNTNNPVLDSTVNLIMNWPINCNFTPENIKELHEIISDLYAAEPMRRNTTESRPKPKSLAQMKREAEESY